MNITFLEIAEIELDETVKYYNYESSGLGNQFLTEVTKSLELIKKYPKAWQRCSKRTRRCQTNRFPYGIVYQVRKDEILIVAIANLHRKPEYWKNRL